MERIYGIDLAAEKFDVSWMSEDGQPQHRIVKNKREQVEAFLKTLPSNARIVAEYTGVYGDLLLMLADLHQVKISYISGYEIKHRQGLARGKSDPMDAARIREYGERNPDKLIDTHFPSELMYNLKELYATRRILVQQRKQLETIVKGDDSRPIQDAKAVEIKAKTIEYLDAQIEELNKEMQKLIDNDSDLSKTSKILNSIPGVGPVTTNELIIKTDNFKRIKTAKKCATLAGISPWPNSTGKSDKGTHVSCMGDKAIKTLLYMCASSAIKCNAPIMLYMKKKKDVERKHYFVVMNNIANKLLKLMYALVKKQEMYNRDYIVKNPRVKLAQ